MQTNAIVPSTFSLSTPANAVTSKLIVSKKGVELGMSHKFMDRKTYGLTHKLKGAELDRKHREYRNAIGLDFNSAVVSACAQGTILIQSIRPTGDGKWSISAIDPKHVAVKAVATTEEEALEALAKSRGLTVEELTMLIGVSK